jgi:hypothetical protein
MVKVIFKPHKQTQMYLLPPSQEMIPPPHPLRIVSKIIEKINIKPLLKLFKVKVGAAIMQRLC